MDDTLSEKAYMMGKENTEKLLAIEGILVVTQAQYDVLPETKNTDGILYLIRG